MGGTILLIDEQAMCAGMVQALVAEHFPGHGYAKATSWDEALDLAAQHCLDCVLVCAPLASRPVTEACAALKGLEGQGSLPVVLILAEALPKGELLASIEAGADDYLVMPVGAREFAAKLSTMLRMKHAEDELRLANKKLAELAEQRAHEFHSIQQRYRHLLEATSDGVIVFGALPSRDDATVREANRAFCEMLGYSPEELLQKRIPDLIPEDRHRLIQARVESIFAKKQLYFETVFLGRDSRRVPAAIHANVIAGEEHPLVLLVCKALPIDLESRPAEPGSSYRILAHETGQLIYEIDVATMHQRCAGAVKQVTGLTWDDIKALQGGKWFRLIHPEDRSRVNAAFAAALEAVGKYELEYRFEHKTDGYRHVEDLGVVLPNEEGVAYRVVGTLKDITARVRADDERRRLERAQQHSQRLESLGILAGGIAHDFNNILAGIIGLTDLALRELPKDSIVYEDLSEALRGGHRAKELVRQILTFSRQSGEERDVLYLHLVVREGLRLIRATLPSNIEIIDTIDTQSGAVMANTSQIHQVLTNFCTNAFQAMPHGGKLEVTVRDVEIGVEREATLGRLQPGAYVLLQVRDTGYGMSANVMERIFDPFFTTKGPGEGTGMGLAVVHGIVSDHGGVIVVESKPNQGATFNTYFPRTKVTPEPATPPPLEPAKGKERILLVDDEESVLRLGLAGLPRLGYEATGCADAREALEIFRQTPDAFDIIVTDYMMPHMTGEKLAAAAHQIRSDLPVILFTGFSEAITEEQAREAGIAEIVLKPIIIQELGKAIRRTLGSPQASTRQ